MAYGRVGEHQGKAEEKVAAASKVREPTNQPSDYFSSDVRCQKEDWRERGGEACERPKQRRRLLVPQEAGDPSVSTTTLPTEHTPPPPPPP